MNQIFINLFLRRNSCSDEFSGLLLSGERSQGGRRSLDHFKELRIIRYKSNDEGHHKVFETNPSFARDIELSKIILQADKMGNEERMSQP
jgi:hypothetical protein